MTYLLQSYPALAKKTISAHSPIHLASRNGHYDIVKALIDKGMSGSLEVTKVFSFFNTSIFTIYTGSVTTSHYCRGLLKKLPRSKQTIMKVY